MLNMENAEEVMQILERFTRLKQKEIPKELDDYMHYVAKTGDTVFKWSSLKYLFREKLLNVIKNFHDTSPRVDDLPQYPNVDPFNYESMKSSLLERLELFNAAPFTVQRLCELLTEPRKQYSRIDKFMRALEKNILVSTIEPGRKRTESENGDSLDSVVNGDASLDVNVDIDMENEPILNAETANPTSSAAPAPQPTSNLIHKADDDILPNPKKPKLDLADETIDAETEAATKSIISKKADIAAESVAEKVDAEEPADSTDKKKPEEGVAEKGAVSDDKPVAVAKDTVMADAEKDNKDSECEKMDEDVAVAQKTSENNNVEEKTDKKEETDSKAEEKEELVKKSAAPSATVEAEKDSEAIPSPAPKPETTLPVEVAKSTDKAAEKTEQIVKPEKSEKTDDKSDKTDKAEKVDNEPEKKNKDCAEEVLEKQATATEVEAKKVVKENDDDKENQNCDIKENEKDKTEHIITTTNTDKTAEKKPESAVEEKVAPTSEEKDKDKSEDVVMEKLEEVVVAPVVVAIDETKKDVEPLKPDDVPPSALKEEPSKPEEAKAAEETTTTTEAVSAPPVPVEEGITKEKSTAKTTEPVEKCDKADPLPPVTESLKNESTETPAEIKPTEPKETEKPAASVETPSVAATTEPKDVPVPAVVEEPAVTADQPMDENPESISEAEPLVPTIVVEAAATVEEVVMAGDSVEMATDAIEPAKDEPAGMEVDDTSQEAMDQ